MSRVLLDKALKALGENPSTDQIRSALGMENIAVSSRPAPWWDARHDLCLLKGVLEHGPLASEKVREAILEDQALDWPSDMPQAPPKPPAWLAPPTEAPAPAPEMEADPLTVAEDLRQLRVCGPDVPRLLLGPSEVARKHAVGESLSLQHAVAAAREANLVDEAFAREAARAQRGRFPTHRPAFRIDRSRNQSSTARAPRDAASRVPRDTIDRSRVIHSEHIFDSRARPTLARSSTRASVAPIAIAATDARRPDHPRRRPLRRARIERIRVERVGASHAPEISLRHVANLVFATGAGRLDDAHGGRHDGCG